MNALDELLRDEQHRGAKRFFLGIARAARQKWMDECTEPLFGLPLILEAEGLSNAAPRGHVVTEPCTRSASLAPADAAYLARCEALIMNAALEIAA